MQSKFINGDYVRIAENNGGIMRGREAIVLYSYAEKYGGANNNEYGLYVKNAGEISWYGESILTLIEHDRKDLLHEWRDAAEKLRIVRADIDWVFENGVEVLNKKYPPSVKSLASCLGIDTLWDSTGEGYMYYRNIDRVLLFASKYLLTNDKDGWMKRCKEFTESIDV